VKDRPLDAQTADKYVVHMHDRCVTEIGDSGHKGSNRVFHFYFSAEHVCCAVHRSLQFVICFIAKFRHRSVEQDNRAAGHAIAGLHEATSTDRSQLRREPAQVCWLSVRETVSRHSISTGQHGAQWTQSYDGAGSAPEDAGC